MMNTTNNNSMSARLPVRYEQHRGVVRYCGPVEASRIFGLCDEIDSLINEYYYSQIGLEIDSMGGEVKSLLYYCEKLKGWRKRGVSIETMALTQCASAAALMLSLGDIGKRRSMPKAFLLYHNARVVASGQQPLTSDRLEKLRSDLDQTDADMLVALLRHINSGLSEDCFNLLEEVTCILPFLERKVDVSVFKILRNNRVNKLVATLEKAIEESSQTRIRGELLHVIATLMHGKQPVISACRTVADLETTLLNHPPATHNELTVAWLMRRFEDYRELFTQDTYIRPEEAIFQGLIDHIGGDI